MLRHELSIVDEVVYMCVNQLHYSDFFPPPYYIDSPDLVMRSSKTIPMEAKTFSLILFYRYGFNHRFCWDVSKYDGAKQFI